VESNFKEIVRLKKKYSEKISPGDSKGLKAKFLKVLPSKLVFFILKEFLGASEYSLKRESVKFFQLSSIAYSERKMNRANRLLMTAFKLLGTTLPAPYIKIVSSCFLATAHEPTRRSDCSNLMFDATNALDRNILDASGWYMLSRGLFSLGYCRSAWLAREISIDLSISEGSGQQLFNTSTKRAIEAHLERRNFVAVGEILNRFSGDNFSEFLNEVVDYLAMMQNTYLRTDEQNLGQSDAEKLFRNLISRQTALVGAGSPSSNHGVEIDSSETVVRLRYVGKGYLSPDNFLGSRCEISCYNTLKILSLICENGNTLSFIEDLKIIIGRMNESQLLPNLHSIGNTPIVWINSELPIYRSTAVSGIRILFSILRFCPGQLKLFGFDFYTSVAMYDDYGLKFYREGHGWQLGDAFQPGAVSRVQELVPAGTFSFHDPVSNFCFAQNLYKAGLFDIEPYGKSILELTPYQYVERLEEMLGDW